MGNTGCEGGSGMVCALTFGWNFRQEYVTWFLLGASLESSENHGVNNV